MSEVHDLGKRYYPPDTWACYFLYRLPDEERDWLNTVADVYESFFNYEGQADCRADGSEMWFTTKGTGPMSEVILDAIVRVNKALEAGNLKTARLAHFICDDAQKLLERAEKSDAPPF